MHAYIHRAGKQSRVPCSTASVHINSDRGVWHISDLSERHRGAGARSATAAYRGEQPCSEAEIRPLSYGLGDDGSPLNNETSDKHALAGERGVAHICVPGRSRAEHATRPASLISLPLGLL